MKLRNDTAARILFLIALLEGRYCNISFNRINFGLSLSGFFATLGGVKTGKEWRNMLRIFKKQQKYSTGRQLHGLIDFVNLAAAEEREEIARTLITAIADKMRVEAIFGVISGEKTIDTSAIWDDLFFRQGDLPDWKTSYEYHRILINTINGSEIRPLPNKRISLSDYPVITIPWDNLRLNKALGGIGTSQVKWRQIENNHVVTVILPMDIAVVTLPSVIKCMSARRADERRSCEQAALPRHRKPERTFYDVPQYTSGRHSICAGVQKRKGSLLLSAGMEYHNRQYVYDISALYDMIEFDGVNYIWLTDGHGGRAGSIAAKAVSFDIGCIFELGRFFPKHKNTQSTAVT